MSQHSCSGRASTDDTDIYRGVAQQMLSIQTPAWDVRVANSVRPPGVVAGPPDAAPTDADEWADSALAYPPEELAPVAPPDYILPTQQEPLDSIEDRTDLPPAGELLYNILHNIEWIWLSPMAELTNRRQLVADIKTLCDEHGYSPQALVASPIRTAQERGDFPGES